MLSPSPPLHSCWQCMPLLFCSSALVIHANHGLSQPHKVSFEQFLGVFHGLGGRGLGNTLFVEVEHAYGIVTDDLVLIFCCCISIIFIRGGSTGHNTFCIPLKGAAGRGGSWSSMGWL